MAVQRLCVVGAGTMGTGIAQAAAQAGIRVHLLDTFQEALHRSRELLARSLRRGVETDKITPEDADQVRRLVDWDLDWEYLSEVDWVIEAVSEDLNVKREVLRRVAGLAAPGTPVATNTLALSVEELGEAFGQPERFLGMHFYNPAPAMKLVLIDPTSRTAPEVIAAAVSLCEQMDKEVMTSAEVPRFVVNRAFGALLTATIEMVRQGADPEAIDSAIELGLGHSMGPLRTADMMGLDVALSMLRSLHEQTGHPRYEPPRELVEMTKSGRLGRKSGEGFHHYPDSR